MHGERNSVGLLDLQLDMGQLLGLSLQFELSGGPLQIRPMTDSKAPAIVERAGQLKDIL